MQKKVFLLLFTLMVSSSLLISKTLVTVNGHKVDDSIIPKGYEQLDDAKRANLMEHLIKEELIHQEILKSNIVKDPKFQKAFEEQKKIAQKEYKKATGKNLTKAQIRNIKGSIALMVYQQKQFMSIKISDQEAREFFNNNKEKFNFPNSIEIANIIVKTKQEAKNIIRELENSSNLEKDFIKLAHEHKQNGYMGWFGEGMTPQNLFDASYKAEPKTLIKYPIKTKYGYHVIYLLNKKKAGKVSFEKAKKNIKKLLKQKRILESLEEKIDILYGRAEIVY
ncbi:MAG: peptidyl-prolyl cis-trans isomerase [Sulfurovaceae bacterium]|nr:peptidyl-prolyl cis-trans isomerase [Sulfurovaceae bacterium]